MTLAELMPTVKKLSNTDKLLLIQLIVQEMVEAEDVSHPLPEVDADSLSKQNHHELYDEEEDEDDLTIEERLEILRKPPKERGEILAKQAEAMQAYYEQNTEWKDWPVEDIIEY